MNKNLNLVKILKDCPKGTKLYSPALGECTLEKLTEDKTFPIQVKYKTKHNTFSELFTKEGYLFSEISDAECMLFPSKDQRDWSKWHRPFVDGDVVYAKVYDLSYIIIYHKQIDERVYRHACLCLETDMFGCDKDCIFTDDPIDEWRLATEEEKQKLFDAIKANGYKWNPKTKTLEKLKKEKFDIKTLKPFESRVLVSTFGKWVPAIFGHYNKEHALPIVVVGGNVYAKCIPYEGNEHLIDTFNQPSKFYRYWEN